MVLKSNLFLFFITTILILISSSNVEAQFKNKNYQSESIYLKGSKYVKNGIEYPLGFFRKNIKREMEISPNAVIEYRNYEKKRNTAVIFSSIGLVAIVSSIFVDNKNEQAGLILGGIGVGAIFVSFPFAAKASNSFNKANWIRNGDILN